MMTNEQVYSLAIERLMGIEIPERAKYIRSKLSIHRWKAESSRLWRPSSSTDGRNDTYSQSYVGGRLSRSGCRCDDALLLDLRRTRKGPSCLFRSIRIRRRSWKTLFVGLDRRILRTSERRSNARCLRSAWWRGFRYATGFYGRCSEMVWRLRSHHRSSGRSFDWQPSLDSTNGWHRCRHSRRSVEFGIFGCDGSRFRYQMGYSKDSTIRCLWQSRLRRSHRCEWGLFRSVRWKSMASVLYRLDRRSLDIYAEWKRWDKVYELSSNVSTRCPPENTK